MCLIYFIILIITNYINSTNIRNILYQFYFIRLNIIIMIRNYAIFILINN